MPKDDARPLCSTCTYHEKQSSRINFMWGAGWAFVFIIGTMVTIALLGITGNSKKIDVNANRIAKHEMIMNDSIHRLERIMTIMSINQKRQMEDSGVRYIDPEPNLKVDG